MSNKTDTATEITIAHKISVGLMVATACMVVLAALAAAIYTVSTRATVTSGLTPTTLPSSVPAAADNTFTTR